LEFGDRDDRGDGHEPTEHPDNRDDRHKTFAHQEASGYGNHKQADAGGRDLSVSPIALSYRCK
jgi:hypothetical protein